MHILRRLNRARKTAVTQETSLLDESLLDQSRRLAELATPLTGVGDGYGEVLGMIGDARFVLLGEATHGSHEFYKARAEISKRLIVEKGFAAVAVEADWPDAYRVNRYVRGTGEDRHADEALSSFLRFPVWMWRNTEVLEFVEWLHTHNNGLPPSRYKAGFYGLDLYSLQASRDAVIAYLDRVDPGAARRARYLYSCFDHYGEDSQAYGYAASLGLSESCEQEVLQQLLDLQRSAAEYAQRDGRIAEDEFFYAEQNARLVKNAEHYYRSMFESRVSSWNLRDRHMAQTLDALAGYLGRNDAPAKIAVWAHNSHLGDARATEMNAQGEWNLGQLVRERYGDEAMLVGFTTHSGTVTAASDWGGPAEVKSVRPALAGSYEALLHQTGLYQTGLHQTGLAGFLVTMRTNREAAGLLREPRLERAIGVIYRPETERISHYFEARLADQFDAVIHFDETRAVQALARSSKRDVHDEEPEMFPSGV
ncbi:MAG: erythromycin esterase family protein [Bryobacteraceae bacterium]